MENIYTIKGKATSYPQYPLNKRKQNDDALRTPSILKVNNNNSTINSESSLNVKFYGESENCESPLKMTLSDKIKSLTANLNKLSKLQTSTINTDEVMDLLQKRENQLRAEFHNQLEKEAEVLKSKFDSILQNEQVRTSYMLSGAHRERKEKIKALTTQLECKNLAGLMYVMCTERKKSKMQQKKIVEEYTKYIKELHEILKDSQEVILNLSRGYKTASRVDREWKAKIIAVINQFRAFVYNFAGGSPETNQYFFNIPEMLKIMSPLSEDPSEDPCECYDDEKSKESNKELQNWWERFDDEDRPFVVFGDMEQLSKPQKVELKKTAKTPKSAPTRWKEYNFDSMPILSECPNLSTIKEGYLDRIPLDKWECHVRSDPAINMSLPSLFPSNYQSRRVTAASLDYRNMGSILKIITTTTQQPSTKTTLLGARDSMELASTTRLKRKSAVDSRTQLSEPKREISITDPPCVCMNIPVSKPKVQSPETSELSMKEKREIESLSSSRLGSAHIDSLEQIPNHKAEKDRVINYEKVCPMPECQIQIDSFIRSLPEYMRTNPFTHFKMDLDAYETCSPEQLQVLKERIEARRRERDSTYFEEPMAEWLPDVDGVSCQTSDIDVKAPPCTCRLPKPSPVPSVCKVYDVKNLLPLKKALNDIKEAAFYDPTIQFDRFELVGEPSDKELNKKKDFKTERIDEVIKILRTHPSLTDLFQANHRC